MAGKDERKDGQLDAKKPPCVAAWKAGVGDLSAVAQTVFRMRPIRKR